MPPRYSYWTIILDGAPTSFRAYKRDELVPTLRQLQAKHPGAVLKWFARGRLWDSPDEARSERQPPGRRRRRPATGEDARGGGWRPGGQHRDPRERFARRVRPAAAAKARHARHQRSKDKRRTRG